MLLHKTPEKNSEMSKPCFNTLLIMINKNGYVTSRPYPNTRLRTGSLALKLLFRRIIQANCLIAIQLCAAEAVDEIFAFYISASGRYCLVPSCLILTDFAWLT